MVASIAASLDALDGEGGISFTADEADCVASRVVSSIGVDRLFELGADQGDDVTSLAWTVDERGVVFDHIDSCIDIEQQLAAFFATDPSVSSDMAACIAAEYAGSDVFPEALFSVEPDDDLSQRIDAALSAAYQTCS